MTEQQLAGMVAEVVKQVLGCSPEEFAKEREQRKLEQEKRDASVRRYVVELEINKTDEDYKRKAQHVIRGDKYEGLGLPMARLVRAYAGAKRSGTDPRDFVRRHWQDEWLADAIDEAQKRALTTDVEADGGFIVPPDFRNSMIELLRNKTIVRGSGIPVVPMRRGSMSMPRQTGAGTAAYVGEARRINPSQQTFGQLNLLAKKLAALSALSNDLIRESDPSADMIVRNDLVQVMAREEDSAFLRGDGTGYRPMGLRSWINSANVFASTGATLDQKTNDLFDLILRVERNNIDLFNACWFISVRTKSGLMRQRDVNGNFVFKDEMERGTLLGWPYYASNAVPTTLGLGTNESEIYFVETSQCIIADTMGLEVVVEPNGTYELSDGTVVSGLSHDLTVVRCIQKHDFAMRHDLAGAVLTGVTY
jgi:HK97 family phage major capsid protein